MGAPAAKRPTRQNGAKATDAAACPALAAIAAAGGNSR